MTLQQLGEQYIEQSEVIRKRIESLRPQLQSLKGKPRKELEKRIFVLYDNAYQCKQTGLYLKYYYNEETANYELQKLLS